MLSYYGLMMGYFGEKDAWCDQEVQEDDCEVEFYQGFHGIIGWGSNELQGQSTMFVSLYFKFVYY